MPLLNVIIYKSKGLELLDLQEFWGFYADLHKPLWRYRHSFNNKTKCFFTIIINFIPISVTPKSGNCTGSSCKRTDYSDPNPNKYKPELSPKYYPELGPNLKNDLKLKPSPKNPRTKVGPKKLYTLSYSFHSLLWLNKTKY